MRAFTGGEADDFFKLCWGSHNQGKLADLVWSVVRNRPEAERRLRDWLLANPVPLEPDRLPTTLPGGAAIPPASTPWPRADSPLPLVDLPIDEVISLAEGMLWHQVTGGRSPPDPLVRRLTELSAGQIATPRARLLLQRWHSDDAALRCWRAAHPPRTPPALDPAGAQALVDHVTARRHQAAWALLVRAGMAPMDARYALDRFSPGDDRLPTGQPLNRWELSAVLALPSGERVPKGVAERAAALADVGRRWEAVAALSEAMPGRPTPTLRRALAEIQSFPGRPQRSDPWEPSAAKWMQVCIDDLLLERPLHWLTLSNARVVADPTVPTMAVGLDIHGRPVLFYSPSYATSLRMEECKGVLCHEVYHILFGHLRPPPESREAPESWTVACEVTVNEYVPYPLPGSPLRIDQFDLPPGESTRARFHRLRGRDPRELRRAAAEDPSQGGLGEDRLTRALSETAAHHRDTDAASRRSADRPWRELARQLGELDEETRAGLLRHAGDAPGDLVEIIEEEPMSRLAWPVLLRTLAGRLTTRAPTVRWPNRRAPHRLGQVQGFRRSKASPTVLVAVDTSGSMTPEELAEVVGEVGGLLRRGLRVACVWCDTDIHHAQWISNTAALKRMPGRGGTDLRPPFARAVLDEFRPELLVYFTDGHGPAPAEAPRGVHVLWVLTGPAPQVPAAFGQRVRLTPRAAV